MRVNLVGFITLLYLMTCGKFKQLEDDLLMLFVESVRKGEVKLDSEANGSIIRRIF